LLLEQTVVEQIFEFVSNHYILVSAFVFLLVAFVINEGKQGGAAITPTNLVNLANREGAVLVDIRDTKEYSAGHIAGALSMPVSSIDARIGEMEPYKDKPVVLVCKMGQHASAAGRKLKALGFENVRRLSGGMAEWTASSLPVVK
jgi:rhodanese-related sulfurtransferase